MRRFEQQGPGRLRGRSQKVMARSAPRRPRTRPIQNPFFSVWPFETIQQFFFTILPTVKAAQRQAWPGSESGGAVPKAANLQLHMTGRGAGQGNKRTSASARVVHSRAECDALSPPRGGGLRKCKEKKKRQRDSERLGPSGPRSRGPDFDDDWISIEILIFIARIHRGEGDGVVERP